VRTSGRPKAEVPKPPEFTDCVASKRKAEPEPRKGKSSSKKTDAQLKEECRTEYRDLRDRALNLLISQRWIEGEAEELGISVGDAEVKKAFDEQRKRSFPKEADYRKWLEGSGQSEADIELRVRSDLLQTKIRERITKGDDKVTEKQIADYYKRNKARFGEPARRDVRLVLTESRAKALQARRALQRGESWRAVAKRHSIDRASRLQGGRLAGVAEGEQEPGLDEALFEAPLRELGGPVKTQFGWYVFEVLRAKRGSQQTLEQAKASIEQLVVAERQQKQLSTYAERFRDKWRARTECRAGFVMQDCKNAPKPTPAPGMQQP
jgi:foldase protein PrsA